MMKIDPDTIDTLWETQVLVIGAGSAGMTAAITAGLAGKHVTLVEKNHYLGGLSTGVLDTFYGFFTPGAHPKKIAGGVSDKLLDRLSQEKACFERGNSFGYLGVGITYNPEILKCIWEDLALEAGVHPLYGTVFTDVIMEENRICGVIVNSKKGLQKIMAEVVIDTSGDADVAARAGVPFEKAGESEPAQTLTTTFRLANVDEKAAGSVSKKELEHLMRQANLSGNYHLPREEGSIHRTPVNGVMLAIMTKVDGYDPCDSVSLTSAEIEGRRQVREYVRFLKEQVPGYAQAELVAISDQIGVRETRRIFGEYRLSRKDVLQMRKFSDAIGKCAAPIEDHAKGKGTHWELLPEGDSYDIPYRTLVPKKAEGLLVAGRCFSATHEAHASCRSMAQCMVMGQAAGQAASLSIDQKSLVRNVDISSLQAALLERGANL